MAPEREHAQYFVSRQKVIYEIARSDTCGALSRHRTQAAVDGWRRFTGVPVRITRWPRRTDGPGVLIAEGTWHEAYRPDGKDPIYEDLQGRGERS